MLDLETERPPVGTRVQCNQQHAHDGAGKCQGRVVAWDKDLDLPVIQWCPEGIAYWFEACRDGEYELLKPEPTA